MSCLIDTMNVVLVHVLRSRDLYVCKLCECEDVRCSSRPVNAHGQDEEGGKSERGKEGRMFERKFVLHFSNGIADSACPRLYLGLGGMLHPRTFRANEHASVLFHSG